MLATRSGVELNPVIVYAEAVGVAELLKLAIVVWVLTFAAFLSVVNGRSLIPAVLGISLFFTGVLGAWSNLRTLL